MENTITVKGIDFDVSIKLQEASIGNDSMFVVKHIFE